jgi:hypothetical protein
MANSNPVKNSTYTCSAFRAINESTRLEIRIGITENRLRSFSNNSNKDTNNQYFFGKQSKRRKTFLLKV